MASSDMYLVTASELSNIAGAIREKTGQSDQILFKDFVQNIKDITTKPELTLKSSEYPEYLRPAVLEMVQKVNAVRQDDSIVFLAMSDTHYPNLKSTWKDDVYSRAGTLFANQSAKVLAQILNIDFFAHLGDVCGGASSHTPQEVTAQITNLLTYFHEARSDLPVFLAIGNHDNGYYYHNNMFTNLNTYNNNKDIGTEEAIKKANEAAQTLIELCPDVIDLGTVNSFGVKNIDASRMAGKNYCLSNEFVYNNFTAHSYTEAEAMGNTTYGGYCYRDFNKNGQKLRVFLLNSSENLLVKQHEDGVTDEQRKWIAQQLLNLNTEHPDWGFIVLCHFPLDFLSENKKLSQLFETYVQGKTITIDNTLYDFANKNTAKFIAQFHGHVHNFLIDQLHGGAASQLVNGTVPPTYEAYRIGIPNAQYNRENYYYNTNANSTDGTRWGIKFFEGDWADKGESACWHKTEYTKEGTSFVINVINPSETKVYSFTYGAGPELREINYDFTKNQYIIDFISDGSVSHSNPSTLATENTAYKTTLFPLEGYKLDRNSITITMGGQDITNIDGVLNIETGEIQIDKVTGNIIISASTSIIAYYTVHYELTGFPQLQDEQIENVGTPSYSRVFVPNDDLLINPYLTTVTMGGQTIPVKLVDNKCEINIETITGPIVIHIEAYKSNLWKFAESATSDSIFNNGLGYVNDRRLGGNGSDPLDKYITSELATGWFTTGLIPYPYEGDVTNVTTMPAIQITGIKNDLVNEPDSNSYIRAYRYFENKTGTISSPAGSTAFPFSTVWSISGKNGVYTLRPRPVSWTNYRWDWLQGTTTRTSHIRFCFQGDGKDVRIDIEGITDNDAKTYSITHELNGLELTNDISTVKEKEAYVTTIKDTAKYKLYGSPTITMGGIDITTSEYLSDDLRTITIGEVTGDVHITANSTEVELTYDNLVADPGLNYGYTQGQRLNSSGTVTAETGWALTNFIPWTPHGGIIRLGGDVQFFETKSSNARLIFYDANQQPFISGDYVKVALQGSWGANGSNQLTGTVDTSENTLFTFEADPAHYADARYFRISVKGDGANMIVTINEPIS